MNPVKEMMSGEDGVSSKRVVLFLFVILFIGLTIASQWTQKTFDPTLKQQLFWLIQTTLVLVFGEKAILAWQSVTGKSNVDKTESTVTKTEVTTKTDANP